jgi:hypothetical protein
MRKATLIELDIDLVPGTLTPSISQSKEKQDRAYHKGSLEAQIPETGICTLYFPESTSTARTGEIWLCAGF